jgi:hypothetical protein
VLHADGVDSYSGSVGFDVTKDSMQLFTTARLLQRFYSFSVGLHDGNDSYVMANCKASSVTLSGAAGGLVSASISFTATTAQAAGAVKNFFIRDPSADTGYLVGYWWSGAESTLKTKSWTFTMSQEVTPVYGNQNSTAPLYLRVGLVDYSLEVESFNQLLSGYSNVVYIATESFTLTGTNFEAGFQYNGVTDLGTYRYLFGTGVTVGDSAQPVIS